MSSRECERMAEDHDGWRHLVERAEHTKWCGPHPARDQEGSRSSSREQNNMLLLFHRHTPLSLVQPHFISTLLNMTKTNRRTKQPTTGQM